MVGAVERLGGWAVSGIQRNVVTFQRAKLTLQPSYLQRDQCSIAVDHTSKVCTQYTSYTILFVLQALYIQSAAEAALCLFQ
jgi:hypothetical protein